MLRPPDTTTRMMVANRLQATALKLRKISHDLAWPIDPDDLDRCCGDLAQVEDIVSMSRKELAQHLKDARRAPEAR